VNKIWTAIGQLMDTDNIMFYSAQSTDLVNWMIYTDWDSYPLQNTNNMPSQIIYADGVYVALMTGAIYAESGSSGAVFISKNAQQWSDITPLTGAFFFSAVISNHQIVVVVQTYAGGGGSLVYSVQNQQWNDCSNNSPPGWTSVTYSQLYQQYFATSFNGVLYSSNDGCSWTNVELDNSLPLMSVASFGKGIIAVGAFGLTVVSV